MRKSLIAATFGGVQTSATHFYPRQNKGNEMKKSKSLIVATFGGALAAGMLTVGTPVAKAECYAPALGPVEFQRCMAEQMCTTTGNPAACQQLARPPAPNPVIGGQNPDGGYGTNRACRESGVCPFDPNTTPGG
jgi:hypothetical protein